MIPRRHDPSLQLGIEGLFVLHLFESGEQPHAQPEARYRLPERPCSLGGAVDYPVPFLFWCVSFGRRVGTPGRGDNVPKRPLKPLAAEIGDDSLDFRKLRRSHSTFYAVLNVHPA